MAIVRRPVALEGRARREQSAAAPRGRRARSVTLALVLALAACRQPPADPPSFAPAVPPAMADWSLEPEDLLRQPLEPTTPPFSLPIVSEHGVLQEALVQGFSPPELAGTQGFVWATGERSVVRFALDRRLPLRLLLRARPLEHPGAPPQRVASEINGVEAAAVDVSHAGEHALELPASALRVGRNRIGLRPAWARAPRDVIPGSTDPRPLSIAIERLELAGAGPEPAHGAIEGGGGAALAQRGDGALSWLLQVPEAATLELSWGAPQADRARVSARVEIEHDDGRERIWEEAIAADGAAGTRRLDLARFAGRPVRLSLVLEGLPEGARWLWTGARIARSGTEPDEAPARDGDAPALPGLNVVVVVLDAAQRHRFGLYGGGPTTPHVDAFARDALVFDAAYGTAAYTLASTTSLFTSQLPPQHGVVERGHRLADDVPVLAELLRGAGYATGAFSANVFVSERHGLARGFDTFAELYRGLPWGHVVPADELLAAALDWLRARDGGRPFFLYLHFIQPHEPYDAAPERFYEGLDPAYDGPVDGSVPNMYEIFSGRLVPSPRDLEHLRKLYEGNLRYGDATFGRLLDELRALGLLDRTLIVLTSDHGEALGEHGHFGHNNAVIEAMTAIPLVVRLPPAFPGRRAARITEPVSTIDLGPLVVESVGLSAPASFAGRNPLRSALAGRRAAPRLLYARTAGEPPQVALWSDAWKCILGPLASAAGPPELVDAGDPRAAARLVTLERCRMARAAIESRSGSPPDEAGAPSETHREALKALGYLRE